MSFNSKSFFVNTLADTDKDVYSAIRSELNRQKGCIELIASENFVSTAVLEAQGSVLTNKYAEGYSGRRYYGGCEYVDIVEDLAIERAKKLFNVAFVNVQPHSGSQANQAVFLALLQPQDTILALSLDCGGHLTHGSKVNQSGKWFNAVHYGVHHNSGIIDYDQVLNLAKIHKPKLIIAGCSAYPRYIDFKKFREIANEVNAYLLVDMAHFAGLVATGLYENPVNYAHVVTTTTHKTLRGPRGGMILTQDYKMSKLINSAVFPGLQGGPLMHVIAAKAVALLEALSPTYISYIKRVVENAQIMSETICNRGYHILTGGTDSHLFLIDLRSHKLTGKFVVETLERSGITCNKNSIPFDLEKPTITSGVRIGTPACTTRGFGIQECITIAHFIADILDVCYLYQSSKCHQNIVSDLEESTLHKVHALCAEFPIY